MENTGKLVAFILALLLFAPACWGELQPPVVSGGSVNAISGMPLLPTDPISCPEGHYAYGIKSWGAPQEARACIGCLTALQLMCLPLQPLRDGKEQLSAPTNKLIPYKSPLIENPDVTCPQGSYISGITGWGLFDAQEANYHCISCLLKIQVTCRRFDRANTTAKLPEILDQSLKAYHESACDEKSFVSGVRAWGALPSVRYCIGCLTGAQAICSRLH